MSRLPAMSQEWLVAYQKRQKASQKATIEAAGPLPKRPKLPKSDPGRSENLLFAQIEAAALPLPELEFRFHPARKWRADLAWPSLKILLEIDGAIWAGGRHVHPAGFLKDMEKSNAAAILGYRTIRTTPQEVKNGSALKLVMEIMGKLHGE